MTDNTTPPNQSKQQLHQAWYNVGFVGTIPVIPPGATLHERSKVDPDQRGKVPGEFYNGAWDGTAGWPEIQADPIKAARWDQLGANVGLKMGWRWVALDLDVRDPVTVQALRAWLATDAVAMLAPIRVGQAPKFLLLFRVAEGEVIRKRSYAINRDDFPKDDKPNQIEVLGLTAKGRPTQAVVAGIHPTGVPYQWEGLNTVEAVPVINNEYMDYLAEQCLLVCEAQGWTRGRVKQLSAMNDTVSPLAQIKTPADLVRDLVNTMPNDDLEYDDWVAIALAIKWEVGAEAGRDIFLEWSAKSPKNVQRTSEHEWDTLSEPNGGANFGKLWHWAKEQGADMSQKLVTRIDDEMNRKKQQVHLNFMPPAEVALASLPVVASTWGDSDPVDLMRPVVAPRLPEQCVPPVLRPLMTENAPAMGVPPEIVFGACMGGVVAAMDDRIKIKPHATSEGWLEDPRLWIMFIGDASVKKTPGLNLGMKPAKRIDRENAEDDNKRIAQWQTKLKRYNTAMKKYTDGKVGAEPPAGFAPRHPDTDMLLVGDATVEKLGDILQHNPRGLTMLRDELSGWFASVEGRGGAATSRADYLSLYNGDAHKVARIGRGEVIVHNWSASIVGGIQPSALATVMKHSPDDGLLQRFYPIFASRAPRATNAATNPANMHLFNAVVSRVHNATNGTVQLSLDAAKILDECWSEIHSLVSGGTLSGRLTSHLSKWEGGLYRWTLVMHAIEAVSYGHQPCDHLVTAPTAQIVADLHMQYFLPSVFALYEDVLGDGGDIEHVRWIAGYVLSKRKDNLALRDLQRDYRAWRPMDDSIKLRLLRYMEDSGWLTPVDASYLSRNWTVNPAVHTKYANDAKFEKERRAKIVAKIRDT